MIRRHLNSSLKKNVDVDNNGKCSYQEILVGMEALVAYTEKRLSAKVDKEYEDFVVGIQRVIDGYKTKGEAIKTNCLNTKIFIPRSNSQKYLLASWKIQNCS